MRDKLTRLVLLAAAVLAALAAVPRGQKFR